MRRLRSPITLPFAVKLYDQSLHTAYISSNGVLEYVSSDYAFGNSCPACAYLRPYHCWILGRLATYKFGPGRLQRHRRHGAKPHICISNGAQSAWYRSTPVDFEIVLHENSNNFEIVYGAQTGGNGIQRYDRRAARPSSTTRSTPTTRPSLLQGLMLSYTKQECAVSTPTDTPVPPTHTPVPARPN